MRPLVDIVLRPPVAFATEIRASSQRRVGTRWQHNGDSLELDAHINLKTLVHGTRM